MFKSFIFGFLFAVIVCGIAWFFIGRNDIGQIRQDFNRVNGDFQNIQRDSDQLGIDSDGFAGDITIITETSRRIENRSGSIDEGLSFADGDLGLVITKVDDLEQYNLDLIRLGRDLGDVAAELRQLNKKGGTEN